MDISKYLICCLLGSFPYNILALDGDLSALLSCSDPSLNQIDHSTSTSQNNVDQILNSNTLVDSNEKFVQKRDVDNRQSGTNILPHSINPIEFSTTPPKKKLIKRKIKRKKKVIPAAKALKTNEAQNSTNQTASSILATNSSVIISPSTDQSNINSTTVAETPKVTNKANKNNAKKRRIKYVKINKNKKKSTGRPPALKTKQEPKIKTSGTVGQKVKKVKIIRKVYRKRKSKKAQNNARKISNVLVKDGTNQINLTIQDQKLSTRHVIIEQPTEKKRSKRQAYLPVVYQQNYRFVRQAYYELPPPMPSFFPYQSDAKLQEDGQDGNAYIDTRLNPWHFHITLVSPLPAPSYDEPLSADGDYTPLADVYSSASQPQRIFLAKRNVIPIIL